ncbi:hypothetical protein LIER_20313 [Lithospermum erythrorhizon]|uniref:Uncharacterized protein n=1 Tax=Lithospermum erythrorhizon TaxID=34254 RepID=A0AAV3QL31_LITER
MPQPYHHLSGRRGRKLILTPPVRMNDDLTAAQRTHQDVPALGTVGAAPTTEVVTSLQKQIDALTERVVGLTRRGNNTELAGLAPFSHEMEINLVPRANQKIAVIALIEEVRMSKFKESLLKKSPMSLEEVNKRAYKYIRIEEVR